MKNVRMALSAVAILAVVGGALAFKSAGDTPDIYCTTTPSSVVTTASCASQPLVLHEIQYFLDPANGSTANPCATGETPFQNSSSACANVSGQKISPVGL